MSLGRPYVKDLTKDSWGPTWRDLSRETSYPLPTTVWSRPRTLTTLESSPISGTDTAQGRVSGRWVGLTEREHNPSDPSDWNSCLHSTLTSLLRRRCIPFRAVSTSRSLQESFTDQEGGNETFSLLSWALQFFKQIPSHGEDDIGSRRELTL